MTPEALVAVIVAFFTGVGGLATAVVTARNSASKAEVDALRRIVSDQEKQIERLSAALDTEREERQQERQALQAEIRELKAELDEWINAYEALWQAAREKGVSEPKRPTRRRRSRDEGGA